MVAEFAVSCKTCSLGQICHAKEIAQEVRFAQYYYGSPSLAVLF